MGAGGKSVAKTVRRPEGALSNLCGWDRFERLEIGLQNEVFLGGDIPLTSRDDTGLIQKYDREKSENLIIRAICREFPKYFCVH